MVSAAVSETWKSLLIFLPQGVKVTADLYISEVLKPMAEAANACFGNRKWTFQQDGAPAHTTKVTQDWCSAHSLGSGQRRFGHPRHQI